MAGLLELFAINSGHRLVDGDAINQMGELLLSCHSRLAGTAGGPGTLLKAFINQVETGTFVQLPPALAGRTIIVIGSVIAVPGVGDRIDNGLPNSPSAVPQTGTSMYICWHSGWWAQINMSSNLPWTGGFRPPIIPSLEETHPETLPNEDIESSLEERTQ